MPVSNRLEVPNLAIESKISAKIMDKLPMIILFLDTKGNISFVNKKILELTGYEEKHISGKQWFDLLVPDSFKSESRSIWNKFISDEIDSIDNLEVPLLKRDGSNIFVLWNAVSFTDNGIFKGIIISGEDITQQKLSQRELEESELLFRNVVQFSPLSIALLDSSYSPIYFNRKFTETFGYALEDVLEMDKWWEFADSDSHRRKTIFDSWCSNQSSSRDERSNVYKKECKISCKDGSVKDIKLNFAKITDDKIILLFKDITEMKAAQKAFFLDELRLEALVELNQFTGSMTNDILNFSLEKAVELTESKVGYIAFINEDKATTSVYSWSEKAMELCDVQNITTEFNVDEMGLWGESIRQRKPIITNDYRRENSFKKGLPEGHVDIHNHLGIPVFYNDKIVMIAGVGNKDSDYDSSDIRQITLLMQGTWELIQRKQSEEQIKAYAEELARNNKELESLDRMKDEFMANITHELKTPLIPIKGYSELLFEGHLGALEEEQVKSVGVILQNAKRLHKLIDSLLYMQNIHSGNIQYHLDSIDIVNVLDKVIDDQLSMRSEKGPVVNKDYILSLPFVCGNVTYLEQVFSHILENALKFTSPEGSITVVVFQGGNEIHVVVKDTGIGIPKDEIQHIFKRFYQMDGSLTRRYGGNGLGLYLCKSIVEAHGGSIWATSEEGKGTEIHVLLPTIKEENI
ncbi:PAS domain S-box protein [Methanolobus mangrovi]|uniref:histidine kinase n=1 Tax=Methanolobus mangrovi TaxID=3072977 RepID=A0AA51UES4_9EURY|nr:ATP-binding protein [Methanolobus mangrovi]WMW21808.1 PAS domain S-box protein [Methanolobus mangrovi]